MPTVRDASGRLIFVEELSPPQASMPTSFLRSNHYAFSLTKPGSPPVSINENDTVSVEINCPYCYEPHSTETSVLELWQLEILCHNSGDRVPAEHILDAIHLKSKLNAMELLQGIACFRCGYRGIGSGMRWRSVNQREAHYCEDCYQITRNEGLIHSHNWNPPEFRLTRAKEEQGIFRAGVDNTLYYGIELEINTPLDRSVEGHAKEFKRFLKDTSMSSYFYFKRDGSISNGYEIVTHPLTARARNECINWKEICGYLESTGAGSEASGECGLHIHASNRALAPRDIGKLKYFFWANRVEIGKLSRRNNYRYCEQERWSVRKLWSDKANYLQNYPDSGNRYSAINVHTGKPTVEFRVLRGTLEYRRLLACFQFVDSLIHYVKASSILAQDSSYSWQSYCSWLRDINRYNHLELYLEAEGLKVPVKRHIKKRKLTPVAV